MAGNIVQYDNQIDGLRPDDKGYEARQMEGRHVEGAYAAAGQAIARTGANLGEAGDIVERQISMQQQLTGLKQSTQEIAAQTSSWNEAYSKDSSAPVHNPHLNDEFMQGLSDHLDTYDQNYSTRQGQMWWGERKAQILQHFREVTTADVSHLAGIQAAQDHEHTVNTAVASSYTAPSSMMMNLGSIQSATDLATASLGANATPEAIALIKEHGEVAKRNAVLSAARGMVDLAAPGQEEAAAKSITGTQAFSEYAGGQEEDVMKYAQSQGRVNQEKQRAAVLQQKEQLETEGKTYYSQLRASMLDSDGNLHTSPALVQAAKDGAVKYGGVIPGEVDSTISVIREAHDREVNHDNVDTNWDSFDKLAAGVSGGGVTQKDIDAAYVARTLSNTEYTRLNEMAKHAVDDPQAKEMQRRTSAFIDAQKRQILGPLGSRATPQRQAAYYAFDSAVRNAVASGQKQGLTSQQLMETVLNPADKTHYFGYDAGIMGPIMHMADPTKHSAAAAAAAQTAPAIGKINTSTAAGRTAAAAAPPAQRLQGESAAAYLKRVGG